jgi:hypothetical protein
LLPATAVDLEANGGLQLAKVRAALSLLVDLKQAGELPAAIISTAMAAASPSRMRSTSPRTCAVAAFASAAVASRFPQGDARGGAGRS